MDALVDLNKAPQGLENEVLAYNTLLPRGCHARYRYAES
jgi:hypothetical protein